MERTLFAILAMGTAATIASCSGGTDAPPDQGGSGAHPSGASGRAGDTGHSGETTGDAGNTGGSGGSGRSGNTGRATSGAISGRSGTTGTTATSGTTSDGGVGDTAGSGASGRSGSSGTSASGTSGGTGRSGTSGGTGRSGTTGATGSSSGDAGVTGASGSGGVTCPLPSSFRWTSSGPLAEPKSPAGHDFVSLKDFSVTKYNDTFIVYATAFDTTKSYTSVFMSFTDWSKMASADQTWVKRNAVAPTIFYFTPKKQWVLTYQWGFQYATSNDPSDPSSWSPGKSLLSGGPTGGTGPIDQTVICDASTCYLFFASDDGRIHRSSMPIGNFPATFTGYTTILTDTTANLFEAVEVYSVQGTGKYLMIVEAMGSGGRYFRAFSADSLGGTFTVIPGASTEATPFAGKRNVTFTGTAWTNDISHGDLVRVDPSETQPVDACNLQLLYQGRDPSAKADYNALPYRPGLLTLAK